MSLYYAASKIAATPMHRVAIVPAPRATETEDTESAASTSSAVLTTSFGSISLGSIRADDEMRSESSGSIAAEVGKGVGALEGAALGITEAVGAEDDVGDIDGDRDGASDSLGDAEGASLGIADALGIPDTLGDSEGELDGIALTEGAAVGKTLGWADSDGLPLGDCDGRVETDGMLDDDGTLVGARVGSSVGLSDGET